MIAQPQPSIKMTAEEYLEFERKSDVKHEFIDGEVYAMSGASENHNLISGNIFASLHSQIRQRPCKVYQSDLRVQVSESGLYTYPDVAVVCEQPKFVESTFDTLINPTVIIEVLSPSTSSYDRGEKFERYRKLDSLQDYVTVAQDRVSLEHYRRQSKHEWILVDMTDPESTLTLGSIQCHIVLKDIYEKVDFNS